MPTDSKRKNPKKSKSKIAVKLASANESIKSYKKRRPHRSFRLSRRRDYVKPLALPGNISFTFEVTKLLWRYRKSFLILILIYILLYGVLVGVASQEYYQSMVDAASEAGSAFFGEMLGALTNAGLIFAAVSTIGLTGSLTEVQQIFAILISLLIWLSSVWLLRNLLAGHKVRVSDALYRSGAPVVPTAIIMLVIIVQLLPAAIAAIGYSAALGTGIIDSGGAPAMLFWISAVLLGVLSAYWITSSLFALVMVTLPGVYPFAALRMAGDLMLGRRIKILLRWAWMLLVVLVFWALILIPIIMFDFWLKSVWSWGAWIPIVPFMVVVVTSLTVVWVSAYVYLLYRKVVNSVDG